MRGSPVAFRSPEEVTGRPDPLPPQQPEQSDFICILHFEVLSVQKGLWPKGKLRITGQAIETQVVHGASSLCDLGKLPHLS